MRVETRIDRNKAEIPAAIKNSEVYAKHMELADTVLAFYAGNHFTFEQAEASLEDMKSILKYQEIK